MRLSKEQTISVSLSALVSIITIVAVLWMVAKPIVSEAVAEELAEDLKAEMSRQIIATIRSEVDPLKASSVILLSDQILQTQKTIAQLERIRQADPMEWTFEQANELVDARARLEAQERALSALRQ